MFEINIPLAALVLFLLWGTYVVISVFLVKRVSSIGNSLYTELIQKSTVDNANAAFKFYVAYFVLIVLKRITGGYVYIGVSVILYSLAFIDCVLAVISFVKTILNVRYIGFMDGELAPSAIKEIRRIFVLADIFMLPQSAALIILALYT